MRDKIAQASEDTDPGLVKRFREGDPQAQAKVIAAYEPLVLKVARRWSEGNSALEDDLRQVGRTAVFSALLAQTFDPARGTASYVATCVRRAIKKAADGEAKRTVVEEASTDPYASGVPGVRGFRLPAGRGAQLADNAQEALAEGIDGNRERVAATRANAERELRTLTFCDPPPAPSNGPTYAWALRLHQLQEEAPLDPETHEAITESASPERAATLTRLALRELTQVGFHLRALARMPADVVKDGTAAALAEPLNPDAYEDAASIVSLLRDGLFFEKELRTSLRALAKEADKLRRKAGVSWSCSPDRRETVDRATSHAAAWLERDGKDLVAAVILDALGGDEDAKRRARKSVAVWADGALDKIIGEFAAHRTQLGIDQSIGPEAAKKKALDWLEGCHFTSTEDLKRTLLLASLVGLGLTSPRAQVVVGKRKA